MKNLLRLLVFVFLSFQFACKDKNNSIYADCCGAEPTVDSVLIDTTGLPQLFIDTLPKYAHIFIPNIFTPNATGYFEYNSHFIIAGGNGVQAFLKEVCSTENGEILFSKDTIFPGDVLQSWNGKKSDGTFYYGAFNYEVKVLYVDAQVKTYSAKACSFRCGDSDFPTERLPDCFFPIQNNGNGMPDEHIPRPDNCF